MNTLYGLARDIRDSTPLRDARVGPTEDEQYFFTAMDARKHRESPAPLPDYEDLFSEHGAAYDAFKTRGFGGDQ